jgi:hypothetical protein
MSSPHEPAQPQSRPEEDPGIELSLSNHAALRMKQRGVPQQVFELLMD